MMRRNAGFAALPFVLCLLLFACGSKTGGMQEAQNIKFPHDKNYTLADFDTFVEENGLATPYGETTYRTLHDDLLIEGYTFTELNLLSFLPDEVDDPHTYKSLDLMYYATTDTLEKDFESLFAKLKKRYGEPQYESESATDQLIRWQLGENYFISLRASNDPHALCYWVTWLNPLYLPEE